MHERREVHTDFFVGKLEAKRPETTWKT